MQKLKAFLLLVTLLALEVPADTGAGSIRFHHRNRHRPQRGGGAEGRGECGESANGRNAKHNNR